MTDLVRAWSTFEIKSFDDDARTFEGIASTPNTDRGGDIVDPLGAVFDVPFPLKWQHGTGDIKHPVGWVTHAAPNKSGIPVKGNFAKPEIGDPPSLVEALNVAWALVRKKLVRGLSIGFKPIEADPIKGTFGLHFKKWEWLELSAVDIPMNAEANILTVKAMDQAALAKSGATAPPPIAATHSAAVVSAIPKGKRIMSTREQVAGLEAKRAANAAAVAAILDKTAEEERTTTAEEKQQCEDLNAQIKSIDEDLVFWRAREGAEVAKAVPIAAAAGVSEKQSVKIRSGEMAPKPNKNLEPGIAFARYVKAFAFAKGNYHEAAAYAKANWDSSTPEVELALKTAISAGTTTDSVWAGPLVYAQDFPAAFLEFLRPLTIIGRIPGMTRVPFNIRYGIQDGGSTVAWVGQGAPKPVSKLTFTSGTLGFAKAAGIVVITQELARFSSPSAELLVRNDLAAQMVYFLDQQFIDPGVAAVANVSPASVTNGATAVRQAAAAWTSMANVLTDIKAFLSLFSAQEISLAGAVWVTTPDVALSLGMVMNTGGTDFAFPEVGVNGGTFFGLPVIVSNSVPHSTSAGSILVLIIPQYIYMADEGGIMIDTSTEASLQMDTAPTVNSATPTATTLVSLWQTNSIGIRVERIINWQRARTYGVGYIDNIHTS